MRDEIGKAVRGLGHGILGGCLLALSGLPGGAAASSDRATAADMARTKLAGIRVPFVENAGQLDPRVKFQARTFAEALYVTGDGKLVHALPGKGAARSPRCDGRRPLGARLSPA